MQEIWIPELIIALFLLLPLVRRVSKKLMPLDGLARLPLPGFLIALVMIPAYGFRPEAFPLLIYAAVLTGSGILRAGSDSAGFGIFRGSGRLNAVPSLVLLAAVTGIALFFSPQKDDELLARGVHNLKVFAENAASQNEGAGGREYFIRVYADESGAFSQRPLLVVIPPVLGSLPAVDGFCGELRDRGFTVLSYSRRGFDSPALDASRENARRYHIGPGEWFRRFHAFLSGSVSAKANARGRGLEDARKDDILFLLDWIGRNPRVNGSISLFDIASPKAVFLAAYGAGGSALVLLGDSLSPALPGGTYGSGPGGITIRGIAAVESRFWSLYREEVPEIPGLPQNAGWFASARHGIRRRFLETKPKKVSGLREIPGLSIPGLFLVSDKSRDPKHREQNYLPVLKCFGAARDKALLASIDGAGPLDYTDIPARYPIIAAFSRGREKPVRNRLEAPKDAAALITWFAAGVLEAGTENTPGLQKGSLPEGTHLETRN